VTTSLGPLEEEPAIARQFGTPSVTPLPPLLRALHSFFSPFAPSPLQRLLAGSPFLELFLPPRGLFSYPFMWRRRSTFFYLFLCGLVTPGDTRLDFFRVWRGGLAILFKEPSLLLVGDVLPAFLEVKRLFLRRSKSPSLEPLFPHFSPPAGFRRPLSQLDTLN